MRISNRIAAGEWRGYWFLPIASGLGYATSALPVYSLGPFMEPLQQAFGWSRAQTSSGLTVAALISAFLSMPIGLLLDRIGPRILGIAGVLAMSGTVALLSTVTGSAANWFALWCLVSLGMAGVQSTIWTSAVASRFEASRGLAFAVTLSGASMSAAIFPIASTWFIREFGWRTGFIAMGGLWATLVLPLLLLFFRARRDSQPRRARTSTAEDVFGISVAEAFRSPALYKLLLAGGFLAFAVMGSIVHFVPILKDVGATPLRAAGTASLIGIFSIFGRLTTGVLLDRFPSHRIGAVAFATPGIACLLLLLDGANPSSQILAAAIFGLSVGGEVDVIAYLTARHFGLKNFGALHGAMSAALGAGIAFGPLVAGAVFDRYAGYAPFLLLTLILMTTSAIALLSLGSPK